MDRCSHHKMLNNQYGYCPGCENDPDIIIRHCEKCNSPYAKHRSLDDNGFCDNCGLVGLIRKAQEMQRK